MYKTVEECNLSSVPFSVSHNWCRTGSEDSSDPDGPLATGRGRVRFGTAWPSSALWAFSWPGRNEWKVKGRGSTNQYFMGFFAETGRNVKFKRHLKSELLIHFWKQVKFPTIKCWDMLRSNSVNLRKKNDFEWNWNARHAACGKILRSHPLPRTYEARSSRGVHHVERPVRRGAASRRWRARKWNLCWSGWLPEVGCGCLRFLEKAGRLFEPGLRCLASTNIRSWLVFCQVKLPCSFPNVS